MSTVFILAESCTGVLGPSQLQAIVDAEKAAKIKFNREHPIVCDFMIKKNVSCQFRGKTVGGFKVHAAALHLWKQGQELKFINVSRGSSDTSSCSESSPSPVPDQMSAAQPTVHSSPARAAVGGGGAAVQQPAVSDRVAAAPKRRCSKCNEAGHQANSKKCSMNAANIEASNAAMDAELRSDAQ